MMSAAGLAIPLMIFGLFLVAARVLRAVGLRPEEEFALPGNRRATTAV
ncbi:MAG: hypothetical protein PF961_12135 [Planctomycetota bacterium]|jgi:hypothetical protein|nr:hypothetical protein [Planctomycetota bacterium]